MNPYKDKSWYPRRVNEETVARLREDYPEGTEVLSDGEVLAKYGYFYAKFENPSLWDHTGDALEDYEPLAEAFLELLKETGKL